MNYPKNDTKKGFDMVPFDVSQDNQGSIKRKWWSFEDCPLGKWDI